MKVVKLGVPFMLECSRCGRLKDRHELHFLASMLSFVTEPFCEACLPSPVLERLVGRNSKPTIVFADPPYANPSRN